MKKAFFKQFAIWASLAIVLHLTAAAQSSDLFTSLMYEPELVMSFKDQINLTSRQEAEIREVYSNNNELFGEKRGQWSTAMRDLQDLMSQTSVDIDAVDSKFTEVLAIESEIKKIKLSALVAIKNILTQEQQKELTAIKAKNPKYNKAFELAVGPSGDGAKLTIRDTRKLSISDDESPLIVIFDGDAIAVTGRAATLEVVNPEDIQSLSVLKGDAATKKYGDEGRNGVVEIRVNKSAARKYKKDN